MKRRMIFLALLFIICSIHVSANGKFFWGLEHVTPGVPYQRALLIFDEGKETLVLQSTFSLEDFSIGGFNLGWVVPVPSIPDLDSLTSEQASELFFALNLRSSPALVNIPASFIIWVLVLVLLIVILIHKKKRPAYFVIGILLWLLIGMVYYSSMWLLGPRRPAYSVDIISEQEVGIYNAKVLHASDSSGLIAWLNEQGFQFQESDQPVLDDYLKRGWVFVVATVRTGEIEREEILRDRFEGLPDPLVIRFASEAPVYPLALTGTLGAPTEIVLYVLGRGKYRCSPIMELKYAGLIDNIPDEFSFRPWEASLKYLSKFKGVLTASQMRQDLELEPAPDDAPFCERYVSWW